MSRIFDYVSTHDVQYYGPWMKGAKNSLLVRNAIWLLWVVRSGATIYHIGFDSDRAEKQPQLPARGADLTGIGLSSDL